MTNSVGETEIARIQFLENQLGLARREIYNLRQQLKSLNFMHQKECNDIKEKLQNWRCEGCRNNEESEDENEGAAANFSSDLVMKEIGKISTNFPEKRGTPRQPTICADAIAKLTLNNEIFTNPNHAMEGLQEFSHMWILFYFHKNESTHVRAKVAPPRLNGDRTGVFATRSPHRPSPIGLSLVKIDRIMGNTVYFSGVDMIDQTPVLDIKPYIPQYDNPLMMNLLETRNPTEMRVPENVMEETNFSSPSTSQGPLNNQFNSLHIMNLDVRVMDGEENSRTNTLGETSARISNPAPALDELSYARLNARIGEREAPDGEEEEPPPNMIQRNNHITTSEGHIRVPSWINHSPVSTLSVTFKERALQQLSQLGVEGEEKKSIICNVLQEDPRSMYLRERWGSHCYVFRISELYVSCKFNDVAHTVTVYQIFQNNASENDG